MSSVTGDQTLAIRSDMSQVVGQPAAPSWLATAPITMPMPPPQTHQMDISRPMDLDRGSHTMTGTVSPDARTEGRAGSVNLNLDDPDVRLAAEALGDLRADFVSSPSSKSLALPSPPAPAAQMVKGNRNPEPLFALLTTSHPLLAKTIENTTSAYGGAKNFSPRFKSSAEYVEGYLTPLANTVGSVGRVTGVEGGVRWFLGAGRRQGSDVTVEGSSKKRRKAEPAEAEPIAKKRIEVDHLAALTQLHREGGNLQDSLPPTPKGDSRRLSFASTIDTLPAYDDMRSPAYTETMDSQQAGASRNNAPWQSRLIMSTSGLSVAMSDESLRSLKYCLQWLRWANVHIGGVIGNLKSTLEQYENPEDEQTKDVEHLGDAEKEDNAMDITEEKAEQPSRAELATRINSLKGDVLKTLQDAINMVSRYAGNALPENARVLVRRHLTSLPQRFRLATMSEHQANPDSDSAVRDGAQKVLVLAKEGLDMVCQVSGIVDGTIVSAEEWCERMGKKKPDGGDQPLLPQVEPNADVKMG